MLSRATFDHLLADVLSPLQEGRLALVVCDATRSDLPIVSVNDAFTALTGYPASEAIGRNLAFLQGPLTEPGAIPRLFQSAQARSAQACPRGAATLRLYHRNGSDFLNEVVVAPIHDPAGALRFYALAHREIRAGSATAPNRRIRFARAPDGTLAASRIANGLPPDWLEGVPPKDRARLSHAAQSCAERGTDLLFPLRIEGIPGANTGAMLRATLIRDRTQPDRLIYEGTLCEPSSAIALAERLHLLEAVMANANDVILVTEAEPLDLPGPVILYANAAITRHTGYQPDQLIGQNPRMLQGPLTDPAETARLGAALRRWENVTATLLNYRADGSTFWNEISCTPIADKHGWWTNWIAIQRDVSERKLAEQQVAFLAEHDPLTGLANRRLAGGRLAEGLHAANLSEASCGVVKIDLDRFKPINDTYGHAAGDAVLAEVANRLTASARSTDTVARIGGDEFMLVLPGLANRPALEAAAARCLARVSGPFRWNGRKLAIEASVGAALYPDDADEPDSLLAAADIALYRAKARGRGRAHVFSDELRAETTELRRVGEDLHDAIDRDEFVAVFQPKIRLDDRRLAGFEALVRWRHPRQGLLRPASFLAVAEAAGLMRAIDACVARQVAAAAARWQNAGLEFGRIAINASADSFAEPAFIPNLRETLAHAGMNPTHLTVEVVESIFISDRAGGIITKLDALRDMGIRIELDDFGTGYAALAHLRAFKVDGIKLDRSFVSGLGLDREDEIITGAIVGLARNLGLGCVAEGIETECQASFLQDLGCENGQGYLFGSPADEATTTALLHTLRTTGMVLSGAEPVLA